MLVWPKKVSLIKKLPVSKLESFLKSNFDLNQTWKIVLTQNHKIWNFNATELLDILINDRRKALQFCKRSKLGRVMTKNIIVQKTHGQNIWIEVKKSGKIGQDLGKLWYLFLHTFWLLLPTRIPSSEADSKRAAGGAPPSPYFLQSLVFFKSLWRTTNCVIRSWADH